MNVSAEDAEDILQETLVKIWAGLPNFEYKPGKHRFRSWLCTVARNTLRNFVQKKANKTANLNTEEQEGFAVLYPAYLYSRFR